MKRYNCIDCKHLKMRDPNNKDYSQYYGMGNCSIRTSLQLDEDDIFNSHVFCNRFEPDLPNYIREWEDNLDGHKS